MQKNHRSATLNEAMIIKAEMREKCPRQQEQHALAIKVLRLKEPPPEGYSGNNLNKSSSESVNLDKHSPSTKGGVNTVVRLQENILLEHIDLLEGSCEKEDYETDDLEDVDLNDGLNTQQFLLLPQCPISIHVGDVFSSSIWVYNESQRTSKKIFLQVDLLTSAESWNLAYKYAPELRPGEGINVQVRHTIRKLDSHILVCEVKYESDAEDRMTLRKFFKVQALESLQPINDGTYLNMLSDHVRGNPVKFAERGDNVILEGIKKLYLQISSLFCNMVSCFSANRCQ